jgi:hypothetical protein
MNEYNSDIRPDDMEEGKCVICDKEIIPNASMKCLDCFTSKKKKNVPNLDLAGLDIGNMPDNWGKIRFVN